MHVVHRRAVGLELPGFGQRPTATAHQQSYSTLVESPNRPRSYVLPAAAMSKVQEDVVALQASLHFGFGRLSLNNAFPAGKPLQWCLELSLSPC